MQFTTAVFRQNQQFAGHSEPVQSAPHQEQKVAIIAGAGRCMGAAIAERLAKNGIAVVINYSRRSKRRADAHCQHRPMSPIRRRWPACSTARLPRSAASTLSSTTLASRRSALADFDDAIFAKLIDINLKGSFNTMREASRRLRNGGRVVNLSSSVVGLYQPTYGVYAATKAVVQALTIVMDGPAEHNSELRGAGADPNRIAVACAEAVLDHLAEITPLGRLGQPEDIASDRRLPGRQASRLDQRPDHPRERRHHLTETGVSSISTKRRLSTKPLPDTINAEQRAKI
jgi:3-oxoacyl-[acyl-carrier protein] reductase